MRTLIDVLEKRSVRFIFFYGIFLLCAIGILIRQTQIGFMVAGFKNSGDLFQLFTIKDYTFLTRLVTSYLDYGFSINMLKVLSLSEIIFFILTGLFIQATYDKLHMAIRLFALSFILMNVALIYGLSQVVSQYANQSSISTLGLFGLLYGLLSIIMLLSLIGLYAYYGFRVLKD
ncbi:MAG: hypothetical protein WCI62_02895 [Erysipelotrichaceae bacterium]